MALTNDQIVFLQTQAQIAFPQPKLYSAALARISSSDDITSAINSLNALLPQGQSVIGHGLALGKIQTDTKLIEQLVQLGFSNDLVQAIYHNKEQDHMIETLRNEMLESLNNFKKNTDFQINNLIESNIRVTSQVIEYKTELDDTRERLHKALEKLDNICDSGLFNCEAIGKTLTSEPDLDGLNNIII